ncbi:hypothetical protein B0A50_02151 [Salinomyces thailandicus]|uniref:LysM domain-containing protein n=1 Tax=Salinomyces thailandicus TaxID=706561 RepID=A0A4U0UA31_9PEZI|nr:hypothetical protein B0A50_02151 [Salinomyces thailandica]
MNASNVRTSSTPTASSSLRPRTKRLISGLDEGDETNYDLATASTTRIASPLPSPFESRSASPIPPERLTRPSSHGRVPGGRGGAQSAGRTGTESWQRKGNESPLAGLWGNGWSTLQNIASDLLSGDAGFDTKDKPATARKPLSGFLSPRPLGEQPSSWGPNTSTSRLAATGIGAGTREEQLAALRAQKRKVMLTGQDSSHADTLGRFKRRTSDEHAASAPPGEHEDRDALVYVHQVNKNDTLAGITIKYNCSANVLRKANRMWPNDTIQSRPTLILPVDSCGAKGRPVPGPEARDLLSSDSDALAAGEAEEVGLPEAQSTNGDAYTRHRTNSGSTTASRRPSSAAASSLESDRLWHHDSWVLLPGSDKPTEIARLSRRSLGYFPRTRRKSQSYSEFNTPSQSLDLTRESTNSSDFQRASSPHRQDDPLPRRPRRGRRPSTASTGYFPTYLAGPGGVGTMNRNVRFPGPAQDGLNKVFAKHLPDVAPPSTQRSLLAPEMPLYSDDPTPTASGTSTPTLGTGMNLENVGGAIESWMRKVATNAKTAMEGSERQKAARTSLGVPGRGARDVGDLIEMTDEFEIGGDEDWEEDERVEEDRRGRKGSVVHVGPSGSGTSFFDGMAGVRGRSSRGGKSGKAD